MDWQHLLDIAVGLAIAIGGWFAKQVWDTMAELRDNIHDLQVKLPTEYIRKLEFAEGVKEIKDMLVRIEDKLDNKEDKK